MIGATTDPADEDVQHLEKIETSDHNREIWNPEEQTTLRRTREERISQIELWNERMQRDTHVEINTNVYRLVDGRYLVLAESPNDYHYYVYETKTGAVEAAREWMREVYEEVSEDMDCEVWLQGDIADSAGDDL